MTIGVVLVVLFVVLKRFTDKRRATVPATSLAGPVGTWNLEQQEVVTPRGRYRLRLVRGTVVSTDQRSDTTLTSAASVIVGEGFAAANSRVSSQTSVVRDIWLGLTTGGQHHIRIKGDVPVSPGQQLEAVYVQGISVKGQPFDAPFRLYNRTTDQTWTLAIGSELGGRFAITQFHWFIAWMMCFVGFPLILLAARAAGTPSAKEVIEERKALLALLARGADDLFLAAPHTRIIEAAE